MATMASTSRREPSVQPAYNDESDEEDLEAILFDDVEADHVETDGESEGSDTYVDPAPPAHPMFSMQGPFEESIEDAERQIELGRNPYEPLHLTADDRQQRLLEGGSYNDTYNAKWKEVAGSRYHPVVKIIAQIAFGVHLLHRRTAESNDEVIRILQRHIDEVDELIRRSEEDITMAIEDIRKRITHLRLPLEHKDMFQNMLEQRHYRHSVLKGNEAIDRIVKRTSILLSDIMVDVRRGLESTQDTLKYFKKIGKTWPIGATDSIGLYEAMLDNTKGWILYFEKLVEMGAELGEQLVELRDCLRRISSAAAAASKRMVSKIVAAHLNFTNCSRPPKSPPRTCPDNTLPTICEARSQTRHRGTKIVSTNRCHLLLPMNQMAPKPSKLRCRNCLLLRAEAAQQHLFTPSPARASPSLVPNLHPLQRFQTREHPQQQLPVCTAQHGRKVGKKSRIACP
jgi:hypothetical protein